MSPSRSKAMVRPSGATSTFIQLPSSTESCTLRVARPGGALTSHLSGFASAAEAAGGAVGAQTEVEKASVAARARAMRAMKLSPFEMMCRPYGPGANMQGTGFDEELAASTSGC